MKPVTSIFLCLIVLLCSLNSHGQGENNNWCFGRQAGLNFNSGSPVFFLDSMNAGEGCAAVSDASGNLLFYASPTKIWDKNNHLMPNGNGLSGNTSSTQGAAIVQSLSNPNQYYVFTQAALELNNLPTYYSVVDMTLNGGNGDVLPAQKNILLDTGVIEKMVVVGGGSPCNTRWLLVHHKSAPLFHAFKIDASGLDPAPVVSNVGSYNGIINYRAGEIKVNPVTNDIVLICNTNPYVELFSFDGNTGVVSNAIDLDTLTGSQLYSAEFSPDGSKMYVPTFGSPTPSIYQYDVSLLPDVQAVKNSRTVIASVNTYGMRLGPDNIIYAISYLTICAITNPNVAGIGCNFVPNAVATPPIAQNGLYLDLQLGNNVVMPKTTNYNHDTALCFALDTISVMASGGYDTYLWSDGNTTQSDTFSATGTKWVVSTHLCYMRVDTFNVTTLPLSQQSTTTDTAICFVNNIATLWGTGGYTSYLWSDGKTTQQDTMSGPGTKWVKAVNMNTCSVLTDTFHVTAVPITTTATAKDTGICFVNNIPVLSGPAGYNTYLWSDGKTTQQDTMSAAGTKWVRGQTGCTARVDTFHVHEWRDTTITVTDTSHCVAYSPITITAPGGYTSYLWSDGKTTQTDTFFTTITKWVHARNGCDLLIDTVHFTATTIPADSVTMQSLDTTICFETGAITVSAPGGYTYYMWNDGTPTQTNVFAGPAVKWVYAQELCSLLIDTFAVSAHATDTTTGRTDTFVCFQQQATINADTGYLTYLWSDGNTGQTNTITTASPVMYVQMHKACEQAIDTFHMNFVNGLSVDLGNDTSLCKGETVHLNAATNYPDVNYRWQDNSTTSTYTATEGGDYSVKVSVGPCSVSDTVRIHEEVINVNLGNGNVPCGKEELVLDAKVDDAGYLWQDGSTNRTYKVTKDGVYSVKVTQGLCNTTAKINVKFEACPCTVVIPTGFSPNNDGKNDKFGATIRCAVNAYKLMVYGRWGNRVFYTEHVNDKWDGTVKGTPVDGDVYNYYLEFKDGANKVYYYKGDVTVVR